jgi:sugar lactone lactonase YvrE
LAAEVAYASKAIDLHAKKEDYARYGVKEYVVWVVKDGTFAWFDLAAGVRRTLPADGVVRSALFPGLWLDGPALDADDGPRVLATLEAGLASPEHAEFVARLAAAKK